MVGWYLMEVTKEYYTVMQPWSDPLLADRLGAIGRDRGWAPTDDLVDRMDEVWEELREGLASISTRATR